MASDVGAISIATAQLQLVTSIINANRAVLIAAGGVPGPLGTFTMPHPLGAPHRVSDAYCPSERPVNRKCDVVYRRPCITPKIVVKPEQIIELPVPPVDECAGPTSKPMDLKNPIQPPWAVLPWPKAEQSAQKIKAAPFSNDVGYKGTMLDCIM